MKTLKLKNGSYIGTDAAWRYQLPNSRTDAAEGLHELPDGMILKVDQNGRVVTVTNATQSPIKVENISPIKKRMAEVRSDPTKKHSPSEALKIQERQREAELKIKYARARADAIAKNRNIFRFK